MGGFSAFPLPGPLESGVCQRLVPSARCAPAPRTPRGRAPPRPPADVGRPSAWAPAGEAQAASGRAAEGGGERSLSGARQAPPPPPGRLTWAGAPPARRWGRARGRGLGGPLGARQSPGEGGRRLIPGIPRAPALASAAEPALGARRPRVRLGVRSGRGQCGARARRRLRVGAPPECAPRSRPCLCPQRGPAGPRWARREPPGGSNQEWRPHWMSCQGPHRWYTLMTKNVKLLSEGSPGCRPSRWPRPSPLTARGPRPSVPARGSSAWTPATTTWIVTVIMLPR
ncbi:transcription cofactor vestigial-like protein 4 isoform X8 [Bos javanicus]|uniref:transcription cofactor vestigial-like protein 4 isoform X8 n=1 Tax=Bos javanicus TaxID=9906 RepID=UPI002AA950A8|nr:transcription cofactor vestigial-like protein 4 isoform X8 [Bos javanicus]